MAIVIIDLDPRIPLIEVAREIEESYKKIPTLGSIIHLQEKTVRYIDERLHRIDVDDDNLEEDLMGIARTKISWFLWCSRHYIILNPFKVLQILSPILKKLRYDIDFVEFFEWVQREVVRKAMEYTGDKCGSGLCYGAISKATREVLESVIKTAAGLMRETNSLSYDVVSKYPAAFVELVPPNCPMF